MPLNSFFNSVFVIIGVFSILIIYIGVHILVDNYKFKKNAQQLKDQMLQRKGD